MSRIANEAYSEEIYVSEQTSEQTKFMTDNHLFGYLKPCNTDAGGLVRIDFFKVGVFYEIGRCPESNTIVLSGLKVSNKHCTITWNGEEDDDSTVTVHDMSSNGTWINGRKIGQGNSGILEDGDEICFGPYIPQLDDHGLEDYRYIFHKNSIKSLKRYYKKMEQLGHGGSGAVVRIVHRKTLKSYALKVVPMDTRAHTEISNMKNINHPNVCKLIEYFYHPEMKSIDLVLEYVDGGNLFNRIFCHGKGRPLSEESAGDIARQIQDGMIYIHSRGIVHRDLKSENVLLSLSLPPTVKIADFGLSKEGGVETKASKRSRNPWIPMDTYCGTRSCCAPEILNQQPYTHLVDTWNMGVIVYEMLTGQFLFSDAEIMGFTRTLGGSQQDHLNRCRASDEAQEFIYSCLNENPKTRPSITALKFHPWMSHFRNGLLPDSEENNHVGGTDHFGRLPRITEEEDNGMDTSSEDSPPRRPSRIAQATDSLELVNF